MTRTSLFVILALVFTAFPAWAEDWTVNGKNYHNVTVGQVELDRVHITYDGGVGTVMLSDLTPELQKRFNYDPLKAKATAAQREEDAKPDWEKISDKPLLKWVAVVAQETENATTDLQKLQAKNQQGRLLIFHGFLSKGALTKTSDPVIAQWIDCVMQNQVCVGMPKLLVLLAWNEPDTDTTSTNGDGDDWETMNYSHFSSIIFLSGGIVKNITQTQMNHE
jgi:hypothetical protein